jgi:hypothetical protein
MTGIQSACAVLTGLALLVSVASAESPAAVPGDRRAAATALAVFSDGIRTSDGVFRQNQAAAGANLLQGTNGFRTGDVYLTTAFNAAAGGSVANLRSARNWLSSYLYVGTADNMLGSADGVQIEKALSALREFQDTEAGPNVLAQALYAVRDAPAFAQGNALLSRVVIQLSLALERDCRGHVWMPFTARHEVKQVEAVLAKAVGQ